MIGNIIGIGKRSFSWASYWILQDIFDVLWWRSAPVGNVLKDISGNGNDIIITGCDFSTPYIPYTSSASFKLPDVAALKTDDSDYIWWKSDGSARAADKTSIAELVGYDFARTIVWYSGIAPYNIHAIGVLKSSITITEALIIKLTQGFRLSPWWSGAWIDYGEIKENRAFEYTPWTPEPTYDADALALFARMTAISETPPTAVKDVINTLILAYKACGYWDLCDVIVRHNLYLAGSGLLDLKGNVDAVGVNSPVFTQKQGYQADATNSRYINTQYIRTTSGNVLVQDSAHFYRDIKTLSSIALSFDGAGSAIVTGKQIGRAHV